MLNKLYCISIAIFTLYSSIQADILIKQKIQNNHSGTEISEIWIGKNHYASIQKHESIIVDLIKNVLYRINHSARTVKELAMPVETLDYFPQPFAGLLGDMLDSITVRVRSSDQNKTINKWQCNRYDVDISVQLAGVPVIISMVIWATVDVPFDWRSVNRRLNFNIMKALMGLNEGIQEEINKITGFQIASDIRIQIADTRMNLSTEVIEISQRLPDSKTYSIPNNYRHLQ